MMKKKSCKTCRILSEILYWEMLSERKKIGFTGVIKVKLVERVFTKKNHIKGTTLHSDRPLNYCPECGRKIERKETVWQI